MHRVVVASSMIQKPSRTASDKTMRLLYRFRFQQIGETWLGAAVGQNAHLFNGVLQLNEVGHFIVSELEKLIGEDEQLLRAESTELTENEILLSLTDSLTKEYAVDRSTAQSAVQQILDYLRTEQVLA